MVFKEKLIDSIEGKLGNLTTGLTACHVNVKGFNSNGRAAKVEVQVTNFSWLR